MMRDDDIQAEASRKRSQQRRPDGVDMQNVWTSERRKQNTQDGMRNGFEARSMSRPEGDDVYPVPDVGLPLCDVGFPSQNVDTPALFYEKSSKLFDVRLDAALYLGHAAQA